jgi:hypothetical protein
MVGMVIQHITMSATGAGTDVAIESAGIVLVRSDPRDAVGAIELLAYFDFRASFQGRTQHRQEQ